MEEKQHYIREHMEAAGVGIVELSRRMGIHRQTARTAIDKSSITLQTLHRIAAALDIEAYKLLLPPDDTRQQDTHTERATGQAAGQVAAHGQECKRPGTYTRCICPHCHSVLRLMADEWRTSSTTHRRPGSFKGAPDGDNGRRGERANGTAATGHTTDRQKEGREQTEKRVCNI